MTDTSPILGYDYRTIADIVTFADGHDLPPCNLLALGLQESGLNIYESTGDGGTSFGCFQLHTPAHGGDYHTWTGYDGLQRSMHRMGVDIFRDGLPRWQWAMQLNGGWSAVVADIVAFQQAWAPDAQGSIAWSHDIAHRQVSKAIAIYALYLKRQIAAGGTPAEPAPNRERELIDALTVTTRDLAEQRATLATLGAQMQMREGHLAGLVASFGA